MIKTDKKALIIIGIIVFWVLVIVVSIAVYLGSQKQNNVKIPSETTKDDMILPTDEEVESDSYKKSLDGSAESEDESLDATEINPVLNGEAAANSLPAGQAAKKAVDYINKNMLSDGQGATSDYQVKEVSGVYKFAITVEGSDYDVYTTKDGELLFVQAIDMSEPVPADEPEKTTPTAKSAKPDVKVFVMSYCPYGLQAQKMYLPVYDLLKDKATMGIYFVNYAMHGKKEIEENLRQYCIQKEQTAKFSPYLKCFTISTPGPDGTAGFSGCLSQAGVDQTKLNACISVTDAKFSVSADYNDSSKWISGRYPKFAVNDVENKEYDVQGSPTIIINGREANLSSRTAQQFLKAICGAFVTPPAECDTVLGDEQAATGFGGGTTTDAGGCGG